MVHHLHRQNQLDSHQGFRSLSWQWAQGSKNGTGWVEAGVPLHTQCSISAWLNNAVSSYDRADNGENVLRAKEADLKQLGRRQRLAEWKASLADLQLMEKPFQVLAPALKLLYGHRSLKHLFIQ